MNSSGYVSILAKRLPTTCEVRQQLLTCEDVKQLFWSQSRARSRWTIRNENGTGLHASQQHQPRCAPCLEGHEYSSAWEALEHFHTAHSECPRPITAGGKRIPADDPCFAFLETLDNTGMTNLDFDPTMAKAQDFLIDLCDFDARLEGLHHLVAKTKPLDVLDNVVEGEALPTTILESPSATSQKLPRSLVYAFEELLTYFILTARSISADNRVAASLGPTTHPLRINDLRHHARSCIHRHLEQAESDICAFPAEVGTPSRPDDPSLALDVKNFGNGSFCSIIRLFSLRTSVPISSSKRFPRGFSSANGAATKGTNELDIIAMYTEYCQWLRSEAARRPRKRLFLDITGLLDELLLLDMFLKQQMAMLQS